MAAGDVTVIGKPWQMGGGLWMVEGHLEAAHGGSECKLAGQSGTAGAPTIRSAQLTCEDSAETAPAVYINSSDGSDTTNGSLFVRHGGSGDDKFHFRVSFIM
jgi:hypothetical protein